MDPAGGGNETGESGGSPVRRGVDRIPSGGAAAGHDLGASRKRKAAVMSEDPSSLVGNGEHLEVAYGNSQKILMEIEDLKAQIDKDLKELGYCEANEKLRVELVLKAEQMQCLKKQNEEVQGKNDGMRKQNEELQAKNDGLAKQNKELEAKKDDLVKENEELRTNIDSMRKRNVELQDKNGGITKWSDELEAALLVFNWQEELNNPSFHPFKVVQVNGEHKEVLDEDDAKLKHLRSEHGEYAYNLVKTALMVMKEYNPNGRYVVPELWNFMEDRKATMEEVLKYLFGQMR